LIGERVGSLTVYLAHRNSLCYPKVSVLNWRHGSPLIGLLAKKSPLLVERVSVQAR